MSYAELLQWQAYRERRGSLNAALRNEVMLAQVITAMAGGRPIDYMPHVDKPAPAPITPDAVMQQLMKGVRNAQP